MNHETEITYFVYKYESIFLVFLYLLRFSQQLFLAGSRFSFQTPCCGGDFFFFLFWLFFWLLFFIICSDVNIRIIERGISIVFKQEYYEKHTYFSWNYVVVSNCVVYSCYSIEMHVETHFFFVFVKSWKMCSENLLY